MNKISIRYTHNQINENLFQERERLQAMMAHLHMTKDAVNNDQDKRDRDGNISTAEKKSVDPPATGKGYGLIQKSLLNVL